MINRCDSQERENVCVESVVSGRANKCAGGKPLVDVEREVDLVDHELAVCLDQQLVARDQEVLSTPVIVDADLVDVAFRIIIQGLLQETEGWVYEVFLHNPLDHNLVSRRECKLSRKQVEERVLQEGAGVCRRDRILFVLRRAGEDNRIIFGRSSVNSIPVEDRDDSDNRKSRGERHPSIDGKRRAGEREQIG